MNFSGDIAQGLVDEIIAVVHKYAETLLLPTALGCLDLAKLQLIQDHMEEDEDEY